MGGAVQVCCTLKLPLMGNQSLTLMADPMGTSCQGHRDHLGVVTVKTSIEAHEYSHFTLSFRVGCPASVLVGGNQLCQGWCDSLRRQVPKRTNVGENA